MSDPLVWPVTPWQWREPGIFPANKPPYPPVNDSLSSPVSITSSPTPAPMTAHYIWNGKTYVATEPAVADGVHMTTQAKIFVGPVDPAKVKDVNLGPDDQWIEQG